MSNADLINRVHHMYALELLQRIETGSVDAIVTDPPYAEIDRAYGRLTEVEWFELMMPIVHETRRVLKPSGSAVFIIQPNYEKVGKLRLWVFKFIVACGEYWNVVQDAYWWNFTSMPMAGVSYGLMRSSVKPCVWIGEPDCYRNQDAVLLPLMDTSIIYRKDGHVNRLSPSGVSANRNAVNAKLKERNGASPMNLIPYANDHTSGHGAGTPRKLIEFWIKYLVPSGGLVVDPFMGSGTTALVARDLGRNFIGSEKMREYVDICERRLSVPYTKSMFTDNVTETVEKPKQEGLWNE